MQLRKFLSGKIYNIFKKSFVILGYIKDDKDKIRYFQKTYLNFSFYKTEQGSKKFFNRSTMTSW